MPEDLCQSGYLSIGTIPQVHGPAMEASGEHILFLLAHDLGRELHILHFKIFTGLVVSNLLKQLYDIVNGLVRISSI
jgi:hypothetical protein